MNSKKFKEMFPSVYEDFFQNNSFVISLPLLMNWASDIDSEYKGIFIKQKIPLRVYLGINKRKKRGINFNLINYFDTGEDKFVQSELIEYAHFINEFKEYFNSEIEKENLDHGYEFNLLSEANKGSGLGYVSIVGLLLNVGFEKIIGKYKSNDEIKGEILNGLTCYKEISSFLNKDTFRDKVLRRTFHINQNFSRELSIQNQLSSLFDSHYPIVSFLEGNSSEKDFNNIKIFGYKLNELDKSLPKLPYIPIDYGLIYTGYPVYTDNIIHSTSESFNKMGYIREKVGKWFNDDIKDLTGEKKPNFIKELDSYVLSKEGRIFSRMMGFLSLDMLDTMLKLYSIVYSEKAMKDFILKLNKITDFNRLSKKCSTKFKKFIGVFTSNFKNLPWMFGLAPNDTMVMGGSAIFAVPTEGYRKYILDAIEKTQEKIPGVRLVYSNWQDGTESKGLILEQDISKKIYSTFIEQSNLILIRKDGIKRIVKNSYIEDNNFRGMILDTINNKIILNGEKLTSKEIKSQNTTIEILLKLLEKKGEYITNKDLPKSSYSTNKNDMSSKIIKPLEKLIKERYEINFKILITGSITDFKLKLEEENLDINILKLVKY